MRGKRLANDGPVATSRTTLDLERVAATASLLLLLADRIGRDGAPMPLSLTVHDASNVFTLCRLFCIGNQRLTLSVVAMGGQLTPTAIDPALVKFNATLLNRLALGVAPSTAANPLA